MASTQRSSARSGSFRESATNARRADLLLGQNGDDTLSSVGGNDVLCGANGNDRLTGGAGSDSFDGGSGTDTAADFNSGEGDSRTNIS
jgi:Ca2+-binding RTX toxin-like protein